jgi:hypothetical protein
MNPHNRDPAALAQPGLPQAASAAGINGGPLDDRGPAGDPVERNYDPVPPRKTITVAVRYRLRGRGQPLHYSLDEGDGE